MNINIPKETLHNFLNTIPAVLYEYVLNDDGSSEFLYMSPASKEILGHPPEYFVEDMSHMWERIDPEDLRRIENEDVAANTYKDIFITEFRYIMPSGEKMDKIFLKTYIK